MHFDNSHNSFLWPEYFIDYLCERWIPSQASTSVLCLHYHPETVHCSTKDAHISEITFLALNTWTYPSYWSIEKCLEHTLKYTTLFGNLRLYFIAKLHFSIWALLKGLCFTVEAELHPATLQLLTIILKHVIFEFIKSRLTKTMDVCWQMFHWTKVYFKLSDI